MFGWLVVVAALIAPSRAIGQEPADSLAARLRRAENAIAVLQQQLAEQAEGGVRTRSGLRLEWYGRVMVNGFGNSRRVNNVDNPQFVRPDTVPAFPARGISMAARQTTLGLAVSAGDVLGGRFSGDVDVDFYGGQLPSSGGRTFPLLRLRTARAQVAWTSWDVLVGQESPLIAGVNPVTVTAMGSPAFAAAGNLWLWLPQVRGTWHTTGATRVGAQAAVLAPTSGDPVGTFDTDNDVAERSQRPYLQGRAFVAWRTDSDAPGEIGCGVHQGWLTPVSVTIASFAAACDVRVPLGRFEVRGEAFTGQALRGLGGGGIGQNLDLDNDPLETVGGWGQVNARVSTALRAGAGCGLDHPDAGSIRRRNDVCMAYLLVRPSGPLFFGLEGRRMRTDYASARYTNDHVTLAAGFEF